jgi:hypothetical protein
MTFDNRPIIAFTPYGRQNTVSVLMPYLKREHDKGLLDEWWLCLNTDPDQVDDLRYAYSLARHHDWIRTLDRPAGMPRMEPKQRNTGYFYRFMTDPSAVYVRFDDDIIYLHEQALRNLVTSKTRMGHTILTSFPIIWNNAIISWYGQQLGIIPMEFGQVREPFCMDPVGWADGNFGLAIHRLLLQHIDAGTVEKCFFYQDFPLAPRQQFSVSCFAVEGRDYAELSPPGVLDYPEEEHWHTVHRPAVVGKDNVIVGDSLVSHYTFFPQRRDPRIAAQYAEILERYRALAEAL